MDFSVGIWPVAHVCNAPGPEAWPPKAWAAVEVSASLRAARSSSMAAKASASMRGAGSV